MMNVLSGVPEKGKCGFIYWQTTVQVRKLGWIQSEATCQLLYPVSKQGMEDVGRREKKFA